MISNNGSVLALASATYTAMEIRKYIWHHITGQSIQ